MAGASLPRRRLTVAVTDARGRALAPGLGRWLREVSPAKARGTVHVAIVSDHRVRTLNRTYRGIDRPTDVLSFATTADERSAAPPGVGANGTRRADAHARRQGAQAEFLGDIVIARGVARRQARAAGHGEATELRVLALHGLLHLLGYDHEHDGGQMARIERRLRQRGGLRKGLIERR